MRYAILSDIHSNLEALTAVLEALAKERIDRYFCLGDIIGYGADPSACLERVQKLRAVIIGGNHDLACIGKLDVNWFNDAARAGVLWTRNQLSIADLAALREFPLMTIMDPFTLVHGTLRHPQRFDYLVDAAQAVDTLTTCRTLFCLVGHTHLSCFLEYDRAARRLGRLHTSPQDGAEFAYQDRTETMRYLVNPGSVGQPRDGDPRASFGVIDDELKKVVFRRVPYDIPAAQRKIRQAGLPDFLADRLEAGR
jgi:diadenosine tetraphosphatase ApaH/serine/threonine PP2A family protein phosphatase